MELRQLKNFLTVYKYGNITKAAQELHISQQALSKQIRSFEKELGVPLFLRGAHGAEPTKYAHSLSLSARKIIKTAEEAQAQIEKMRQDEAIPVRLGYVKGDFNFHGALPPRTIFEWEKKFPQMQLEISEQNPDVLERMLLQEELELACTLNGDPNPELHKIRIAVEPAYLLINKSNPLIERSPITKEALAEQSFLLSRTDPLPKKGRLSLEQLLGYPPRFSVFNGSFEQGIEHVRAGEGILFSGRAYCLSRCLDGLAAVPFPDEKAVFEHYLAYKKGVKPSEPVQYFIKKLQTKPEPAPRPKSL